MEAATLQYRITQILKATQHPLNAGAIRQLLNKQEGATPVTKSDVNKVVYSMQKQGHTVMSPSDVQGEVGVGAPLWDLCPELKKEPEAKDLPGNKDEEAHPEPTAVGANSPR